MKTRKRPGPRAGSFYNRSMPRQNPKLSKRGKKVFFGELPLKEQAATFPEADIDNCVVVGPFGPVATMFGHHKNTHVMYFLKDPADKDAVAHQIQHGKISLFHRRSGQFGVGTIPLFWRQNPPLTKYLAGAIQFFVSEENELVITNMSVRPQWGRNGLNSLMVRLVEENFPHTGETAFDDPTDQGRAFMASRKKVR